MIRNGYTFGQAWILTGSHKDTADNQQLLVVSSEHTQQHQNNASSSQDTEPNRQAADTNVHGVMTVYIERLGGPEHQHRKEVGAGDERDHECKTQSTGLLLQASWKDRIPGSIDLPECERDKQYEANDQRSKNVCR